MNILRAITSTLFIIFIAGCGPSDSSSSTGATSVQPEGSYATYKALTREKNLSGYLSGTNRLIQFYIDVSQVGTSKVIGHEFVLEGASLKYQFILNGTRVDRMTLADGTCTYVSGDRTIPKYMFVDDSVNLGMFDCGGGLIIKAGLYMSKDDSGEPYLAINVVYGNDTDPDIILSYLFINKSGDFSKVNSVNIVNDKWTFFTTEQ